MNNWRNIILILVVCVGLVFCSLLFFRDDFETEVNEANLVLDKYLPNITPVALKNAINGISPASNPGGGLSQFVAQTPGNTLLNAVTGATPRIINWVSNIINQAKPAVVGICVGNANLTPPWQQGWEIKTPSGRRSVGSGIIINPQGYILTNYHVVALSGDIVVSLFDATGYQDYPAELIAGEKTDDLALLKIVNPLPNQSFPAVPLGNSDKVKVGDKVIAIGNPFGLSQTVTSGIISARRRKLPIGGVVLRNVFQTDVPISPGNSGGALLNIRGEIIGVNTAIYSPIESVYTGISFAVPINRAKRLFGNFIDLNPASAQQPAVKPVGYKFVQQSQTNYRYVAATPPTPPNSLPVQAKVIPPPVLPPSSPLQNRIQPSPGEGIEEIAWLGIDFIPDNDSRTTTSEVEVDEIEGITPMEAGLQAGDIVRSVNNYPTPNIYELKEAIKRVPLEVGQGVVLNVYRPRNQQSLYIGFRLKKWDLKGR